MVTLNYQTFGSKGFQIRLRLYQDGETKYINVTKLLKGEILKKHWNQKKQYFIASCPFSSENNETLANFKRQYEEKALTWKGSLYGFINSFEKTDDGEELLTMESLFQFIIQEQKKKFHADGTRKDTFECYEKVRKKLIAYCQYAGIKYEKLMVCDMTTAFIDNIFDWICDKNAGKGYMYVSKMLHAVMNFADKKGIFDMNTIRSARWKKKRLEAQINTKLLQMPSASVLRA